MLGDLKRVDLALLLSEVPGAPGYLPGPHSGGNKKLGHRRLHNNFVTPAAQSPTTRVRPMSAAQSSPRSQHSPQVRTHASSITFASGPP